jgi:hypothetical protein
MHYWITGAIGSSFWPYYDRFHAPWPIPEAQRTTVPTAYAERTGSATRPVNGRL